MLGDVDGLTVFDVGAHSGVTSRSYRNLFPTAAIHAFEPTPAAIEPLRKMFAGDDAVQIHALALSDRQGGVDLNLNASGATNSLLPSDPDAPADWRPLVETERIVKVATQSIDAFCNSHSISRVDVLKIDVQGAESAVLRGAHDMLGRRAIGSVYLEIIVAPTYLGQSRPDELFALLERGGLQLIDFYDIWKRGPLLLQFDALFALPELVKRIADPI